MSPLASSWPWLALAACVAAPPAPSPPPNVVVIIADDQAWTDFGFMGHPVIRTPRLDRLAAQSALFPRGYVPTSLCRPSLASIITGLHPHEHGITGNDPPQGVERARMLAHIARVRTLPQLIGAAGYRSLQTGKWWEGNCRCGGFGEGMTHGDPARGGRHGDEGLRIGRQTMAPIFDFIDACGEAPFFVWYAPFLPHSPHDPPERLLERYRASERSLHVARYYAMCEWLDETCGQLLDFLDERALTERTMVVFVVDNGWIQRPDAPGYAPRSKRTPYEGGVRTPILVRWPGHVPPGRHDVPVSSIDLAPTILRACGVAVPPELAGVDLRALARGEATARGPVFGAIFSHDVVDVDDPRASLLHRWSVDGRWKLIVPADAAREAELYDVIADPHETDDRTAAEPEVVRAARRVLDGWWPAGR
jgi:uncharacterized sulfatase